MPTETHKETLKIYGEMLVEAFDYGLEVFKELMKPWSLDERWGAILEFEALSPEKMAQLVTVEPNWFEWCECEV